MDKYGKQKLFIRGKNIEIFQLFFEFFLSFFSFLLFACYSTKITNWYRVCHHHHHLVDVYNYGMIILNGRCLFIYLVVCLAGCVLGWFRFISRGIFFSTKNDPTIVAWLVVVVYFIEKMIMILYTMTMDGLASFPCQS